MKKELNPPFPKALGNYVVHATSWRGYWAILASGEITPNAGQFRASYYERYYCKEIRGISLLHMPRIAEAYQSDQEIDSDWLQVLSFHRPFTILLATFPDRLASNLRLPEDSDALLGSAERPFMSPGEICHIGPISTSIIERVYLSLDHREVSDVTGCRQSKQKIVDAANRLRLKASRSRSQSGALAYFMAEPVYEPLTVAELDQVT